MLKSLFRVFMAFLLLACMGGCPALWNPTKPAAEPSAEELYQEAEKRFKDKEYTEAVDAFQRLKSAYPDFEKMPGVYVKVGDALYANGDYEKAISRYLQFLELYPAHSYVPRVKYYIAMSYFNQIKKLDLDNALLQRAAESFKSLSNDEKAGKWAEKAKEKYEECRKKLAEKEMYKAHTYWSMGNYQAARVAAQRVLDQYPKLGYDEEAEDLIKRAKAK